MGIECSVHQGKGIADVINCAQRACLFPLSPLYNLNEKTLTIEFRKALTLIFRKCDIDYNNKWTDKNLI